MPCPSRNSAGPIWSQKMKGPTICRRADGRARRTSNPPRSRARGTITISIASQARLSPGCGSSQGWQLSRCLRDQLTWPSPRSVRARGGTLQRPQAGLNLLALSLQKGRQRQLFAKRLQRLIGREAGPIRGDLEQDAIRLPKVQAAEVEAINGAARWQPQALEALRPGLVVAVRNTEGDVMHASSPGFGNGQVCLFSN